MPDDSLFSVLHIYNLKFFPQRETCFYFFLYFIFLHFLIFKVFNFLKLDIYVNILTQRAKVTHNHRFLKFFLFYYFFLFFQFFFTFIQLGHFNIKCKDISMSTFYHEMQISFTVIFHCKFLIKNIKSKIKYSTRTS